MKVTGFPFFIHYMKAINLRESDPDLAIDMLSEMREEAIKANSSYWRLMAEHWRVQVYLNFKRDYVNANRFAVEAAIESRKPEYQHHSEFVCVQNDLILVYEGIDPLGYASEIKEAIDLTIDQTHPGMNCHYCLNNRLIDYYVTTGDMDKARDQAAKFFAITHSQPHYRIQAYEELCFFSREDEAWTDLIELSQRGQEAARENDDESAWIELKSYEVLALQKLGRIEEAQSAHNLLRMRVASLKMVHSDNYYDNLVAYQEALGDLEAALQERNQHLEIFKNAGRYYWECLALLDKIRLLRLMGQDTSAATQAVHETASKLKSPEKIITRLEA